MATERAWEWALWTQIEPTAMRLQRGLPRSSAMARESCHRPRSRWWETEGPALLDQLCTIAVPVHALPWLQPHAYPTDDRTSLGMPCLWAWADLFHLFVFLVHCCTTLLLTAFKGYC